MKRRGILSGGSGRWNNGHWQSVISARIVPVDVVWYKYKQQNGLYYYELRGTRNGEILSSRQNLGKMLVNNDIGQDYTNMVSFGVGGNIEINRVGKINATRGFLNLLKCAAQTIVELDLRGQFDQACANGEITFINDQRAQYLLDANYLSDNEPKIFLARALPSVRSFVTYGSTPALAFTAFSQNYLTDCSCRVIPTNSSAFNSSMSVTGVAAFDENNNELCFTSDSDITQSGRCIITNVRAYNDILINRVITNRYNIGCFNGNIADNNTFIINNTDVISYDDAFGITANLMVQPASHGHLIYGLGTSTIEASELDNAFYRHVYGYFSTVNDTRIIVNRDFGEFVNKIKFNSKVDATVTKPNGYKYVYSDIKGYTLPSPVIITPT